MIGAGAGPDAPVKARKRRAGQQASPPGTVRIRQAARFFLPAGARRPCGTPARYPLTSRQAGLPRHRRPTASGVSSQHSTRPEPEKPALRAGLLRQHR